jgi:hypothetical protein
MPALVPYCSPILGFAITLSAPFSIAEFPPPLAPVVAADADPSGAAGEDRRGSFGVGAMARPMTRRRRAMDALEPGVRRWISPRASSHRRPADDSPDDPQESGAPAFRRRPRGPRCARADRGE